LLIFGFTATTRKFPGGGCSLLGFVVPNKVTLAKTARG